MVKKQLTAFERHIIELKGTEAPHTGLYVATSSAGTYACKKCGQALFSSADKFNSHCGWPSFDNHFPGQVTEKPDLDGERTEIVCSHCQAHLGHVFRGEHMTAKNTRHCVNSVALLFEASEVASAKTVTLASGCFWGTQHFLARIPGVISTVVGYTGGHKKMPTYEDVCTGTTGHVEAVSVTYDPSKVDLTEILRVFFETHDFTQRDGQGPDLGSQYLSRMFYSNDQERMIMEQVTTELRQLGYDVATEAHKVEPFWPAEDYHQLYYERKGDTPYCHRYRRIFQR